MKVNVKELDRTTKENNNSYNYALKYVNDAEGLNELAKHHPSCYRLSAGAKRLIILNALDKATTAKDIALLVRTLNEIDIQEDKENGGLRAGHNISTPRFEFIAWYVLAVVGGVGLGLGCRSSCRFVAATSFFQRRRGWGSPKSAAPIGVPNYPKNFPQIFNYL